MTDLAARVRDFAALLSPAKETTTVSPAGSSRSAQPVCPVCKRSPNSTSSSATALAANQVQDRQPKKQPVTSWCMEPCPLILDTRDTGS